MKHLPTTAAVPALLLALAAGLPAAAQPAGDDWQRCRAVSAAAARLACYDALVDAGIAPARTPAPAPTSAAAPAAAPAPAPVAAAAPNAPAPADATAGFGLQTAAQSLQELRSSLPGLFQGWGPNARLRLANGQVWQVVDGSSAALYLRDPAVTVRRAALGSFLMEIAGTNHAPRVRRVE
ncbi:MAG: hypothetical protein KF683_09140 [Rubrivivax sp.]|nr:hypothetical protein [Rubrivivax sp.]